MREQKNTTVSFVMNWKRKLHQSFTSISLRIGIHVDTRGCIAGEVLLRIWETKQEIALRVFTGKLKRT